MSRVFAEQIKKCRHDASLTQEIAAEALSISRRTLAAYEGDEKQVPEDIVIGMTGLYQTKGLAYCYLKHQNMVGNRFLPELVISDLATAVLRLKKEINDVHARERKIFDITCDGVIDMSEEAVWETIQQELKESAAAALVLSCFI